MTQLKKIVLLCLYSIIAFFGFSQSKTFKQTIHFVTGKYNIDKTNVQLDNLFAITNNYVQVLIAVEGNTDNIGSYKINKKLSVIRANAVKKYLVKHGIDESIITVKGLASKNPVASNKTKKGRSLNRRVDIIVTYFNNPVEEKERTFNNELEQKKQIESIHELYKQLATPMQSFCINLSKDTILRCAKGTIIYIKANSIITNSNTGSCIQFNVKEDFLKSEMVLDNLSTTSNGEILETQGMIYTEALDTKGNKLELVKGKDMVIMLPTDTIRSDAKIFDGQREHDSVMNWTLNNNELLNGITFEQFRNYWCFCKGVTDKKCEKCHFIFCKIVRGIQNMTSDSLKKRNKQLKECEKRTRIAEKFQDLMQAMRTNNPYKIDEELQGDANFKFLHDYMKVDSLMKLYKVSDPNKLLDVVNKKLYDSFKVSNFADLQLALEKAGKKRIETDYEKGIVSFSNFKYYIFNATKLGWKNCDIFRNISPSEQVDIIVNLDVSKNIDCKLIFRKRDFVLPPDTDSLKYRFKKIPKDEKAILVALKYENNIPYLSMQEITTAAKTFDIEFKQYTLEQLKQELKKLD